jgi:hypothetical protein
VGSHPRSSLLAALVVFAALCSLACSKASEAAKPGPSSAAASASVAPSASSPRPEGTKAACRALVVTGRVMVNGAELVVGSLLDGEHWLDLDAGASVALRHTLTSREFKLIGPARVLPCRAGAEQLLLASGQLTTSANLGVRPGAEVLIATPQGTVHYGDAALDLELSDKGLRVRVKQGEAWVEPEARGKPRFKNPLRSGTEAHLLPGHAPARELVATCQAAAEAAEASARRVLEPAADAGAATLGERASAHMRERGKARVACAVAAASVGTTSDLAEQQSLSASVVHADALWQQVPRAISGQKN